MLDDTIFSRIDVKANLRVEIELRSRGPRGLQMNVVRLHKSLRPHRLHLSKGVYQPYQPRQNNFISFVVGGEIRRHHGKRIRHGDQIDISLRIWKSWEFKSNCIVAEDVNQIREMETSDPFSGNIA